MNWSRRLEQNTERAHGSFQNPVGAGRRPQGIKTKHMLACPSPCSLTNMHSLHLLHPLVWSLHNVWHDDGAGPQGQICKCQAWPCIVRCTDIVEGFGCRQVKQRSGRVPRVWTDSEQQGQYAWGGQGRAG